VALNDRDERESLAGMFLRTPYLRPPQAPVMYLKPRNTCVASPACVEVPPETDLLDAGVVLAMRIGRTASKVTESEALRYISGWAVAIDLAEPHSSFYRPAVRQRCRDGFLPIGDFSSDAPDLQRARLETLVDGVLRHSRSLTSLVLSPQTLLEAVTEFMTLEVGDILLTGLPAKPPQASAGQRVGGRFGELPEVSVELLRVGPAT
jgi:5-oxopent-3-ene-1,2,5-tricarboxylate decarboxylase/2-hydroxyhepta-2,4-diene-1,7-dioate isomerase